MKTRRFGTFSAGAIGALFVFSLFFKPLDISAQATAVTTVFEDLRTGATSNDQLGAIENYENVINVEPVGDANKGLALSRRLDATELTLVDVPNEVRVGETFWLRVKVKNSGSAPWSRAAGITMAAYSPAVNFIWGRAYFLNQEYTTEAGGEGIYTLQLKAPKANGTYPLQVRMIHKNVEWFGAPSAKHTIQVTGATERAPRSQDLLGAIEAVSPDGVISGWACARDISQPVRYRLFLDGPPGVGELLAEGVANAPTATGQGDLRAVCNSTSASHRFSYRLTQYRRVIHSGESVYVQVLSPVDGAEKLIDGSGLFALTPYQVRNEASEVVWTQTPPANVSPGQMFTVKFTVRNTGSATWSKTLGHSLAFVPADRNVSDTIFGSRLFEIADSVRVRPGQVQEFAVALQAPLDRGQYPLQFQMNHDREGIFGPVSLVVPVNVEPGVMAVTQTGGNGRGTAATATHTAKMLSGSQVPMVTSEITLDASAQAQVWPAQVLPSATVRIVPTVTDGDGDLSRVAVQVWRVNPAATDATRAGYPGDYIATVSGIYNLGSVYSTSYTATSTPFTFTPTSLGLPIGTYYLRIAAIDLETFNLYTPPARDTKWSEQWILFSVAYPPVVLPVNPVVDATVAIAAGGGTWPGSVQSTSQVAVTPNVSDNDSDLSRVAMQVWRSASSANPADFVATVEGIRIYTGLRNAPATPFYFTPGSLGLAPGPYYLRLAAIDTRTFNQYALPERDSKWSEKWVYFNLAAPQVISQPPVVNAAISITGGGTWPSAVQTSSTVQITPVITDPDGDLARIAVQVWSTASSANTANFRATVEGTRDLGSVAAAPATPFNFVISSAGLSAGTYYLRIAAIDLKTFNQYQIPERDSKWTEKWVAFTISAPPVVLARAPDVNSTVSLAGGGAWPSSVGLNSTVTVVPQVSDADGDLARVALQVWRAASIANASNFVATIGGIRDLGAVATAPTTPFVFTPASLSLSAGTYYLRLAAIDSRTFNQFQVPERDTKWTEQWVTFTVAPSAQVPVNGPVVNATAYLSGAGTWPTQVPTTTTVVLTPQVSDADGDLSRLALQVWRSPSSASASQYVTTIDSIRDLGGVATAPPAPFVFTPAGLGLTAGVYYLRLAAIDIRTFNQYQIPERDSKWTEKWLTVTVVNSATTPPPVVPPPTGAAPVVNATIAASAGFWPSSVPQGAVVNVTPQVTDADGDLWRLSLQVWRNGSSANQADFIGTISSTRELAAVASAPLSPFSFSPSSSGLAPGSYWLRLAAIDKRTFEQFQLPERDSKWTEKWIAFTVIIPTHPDQGPVIGNVDVTVNAGTWPNAVTPNTMVSIVPRVTDLNGDLSRLAVQVWTTNNSVNATGFVGAVDAIRDLGGVASAPATPFEFSIANLKLVSRTYYLRVAAIDLRTFNTYTLPTRDTKWTEKWIPFTVQGATAPVVNATVAVNTGNIWPNTVQTIAAVTVTPQASDVDGDLSRLAVQIWRTGSSAQASNFIASVGGTVDLGRVATAPARAFEFSPAALGLVPGPYFLRVAAIDDRTFTQYTLPERDSKWSERWLPFTVVAPLLQAGRVPSVSFTAALEGAGTWSTSIPLSTKIKITPNITDADGDLSRISAQVWRTGNATDPANFVATVDGIRDLGTVTTAPTTPFIFAPEELGLQPGLYYLRLAAIDLRTFSYYSTPQRDSKWSEKWQSFTVAAPRVPVVNAAFSITGGIWTTKVEMASTVSITPNVTDADGDLTRLAVQIWQPAPVAGQPQVFVSAVESIRELGAVATAPNSPFRFSPGELKLAPGAYMLRIAAIDLRTFNQYPIPERDSKWSEKWVAFTVPTPPPPAPPKPPVVNAVYSITSGGGIWPSKVELGSTVKVVPNVTDADGDLTRIALQIWKKPSVATTTDYVATVGAIRELGTVATAPNTPFEFTPVEMKLAPGIYHLRLAAIDASTFNLYQPPTRDTKWTEKWVSFTVAAPPAPRPPTVDATFAVTGGGLWPNSLQTNSVVKITPKVSDPDGDLARLAVQVWRTASSAATGDYIGPVEGIRDLTGLGAAPATPFTFSPLDLNLVPGTYYLRIAGIDLNTFEQYQPPARDSKWTEKWIAFKVISAPLPMGANPVVNATVAVVDGGTWPTNVLPEAQVSVTPAVTDADSDLWRLSVQIWKTGSSANLTNFVANVEGIRDLNNVRTAPTTPFKFTPRAEGLVPGTTYYLRVAAIDKRTFEHYATPERDSKWTEKWISFKAGIPPARDPVVGVTEFTLAGNGTWPLTVRTTSKVTIVPKASDLDGDLWRLAVQIWRKNPLANNLNRASFPNDFVTTLDGVHQLGGVAQLPELSFEFVPNSVVSPTGLGLEPGAYFVRVAVIDRRAFELYELPERDTKWKEQWTAFTVVPATDMQDIKPNPPANLLILSSNKCLDISGEPKEGATLHQWDCTDASAKWSIELRVPLNRFLIRSAEHNLCVDVEGGSHVNGKPLVLAECDTDVRDWEFVNTSDTSPIRYQPSGRCIDIMGSTTTNGSPAVQSTCSSVASQKLKHTIPPNTDGLRLACPATVMGQNRTFSDDSFNYTLTYIEKKRRKVEARFRDNGQRAFEFTELAVCGAYREDILLGAEPIVELKVYNNDALVLSERYIDENNKFISAATERESRGERTSFAKATDSHWLRKAYAATPEEMAIVETIVGNVYVTGATEAEEKAFKDKLRQDLLTEFVPPVNPDVKLVLKLAAESGFPVVVPLKMAFSSIVVPKILNIKLNNGQELRIETIISDKANEDFNWAWASQNGGQIYTFMNADGLRLGGQDFVQILVHEFVHNLDVKYGQPAMSSANTADIIGLVVALATKETRAQTPNHGDGAFATLLPSAKYHGISTTAANNFFPGFDTKTGAQKTLILENASRLMQANRELAYMMLFSETGIAHLASRPLPNILGYPQPNSITHLGVFNQSTMIINLDEARNFDEFVSDEAVAEVLSKRRRTFTQESRSATAVGVLSGSLSNRKVIVNGETLTLGPQVVSTDSQVDRYIVASSPGKVLSVPRGKFSTQVPRVLTDTAPMTQQQLTDGLKPRNADETLLLSILNKTVQGTSVALSDHSKYILLETFRRTYSQEPPLTDSQRRTLQYLRDTNVKVTYGDGFSARTRAELPAKGIFFSSNRVDDAPAIGNLFYEGDRIYRMNLAEPEFNIDGSVRNDALSTMLNSLQSNMAEFSDNAIEATARARNRSAIGPMYNRLMEVDGFGVLSPANRIVFIQDIAIGLRAVPELYPAMEAFLSGSRTLDDLAGEFGNFFDTTYKSMGLSAATKANNHMAARAALKSPDEALFLGVLARVRTSAGELLSPQAQAYYLSQFKSLFLSSGRSLSFSQREILVFLRNGTFPITEDKFGIFARNNAELATRGLGFGIGSGGTTATGNLMAVGSRLFRMQMGVEPEFNPDGSLRNDAISNFVDQLRSAQIEFGADADAVWSNTLDRTAYVTVKDQLNLIPGFSDLTQIKQIEFLIELNQALGDKPALRPKFDQFILGKQPLLTLQTDFANEFKSIYVAIGSPAVALAKYTNDGFYKAGGSVMIGGLTAAQQTVLRNNIADAADATDSFNLSRNAALQIRPVQVTDSSAAPGQNTTQLNFPVMPLNDPRVASVTIELPAGAQIANFARANLDNTGTFTPRNSDNSLPAGTVVEYRDANGQLIGRDQLALSTQILESPQTTHDYNFSTPAHAHVAVGGAAPVPLPLNPTSTTAQKLMGAVNAGATRAKITGGALFGIDDIAMQMVVGATTFMELRNSQQSLSSSLAWGLVTFTTGAINELANYSGFEVKTDFSGQTSAEFSLETLSSSTWQTAFAFTHPVSAAFMIGGSAANVLEDAYHAAGNSFMLQSQMQAQKGNGMTAFNLRVMGNWLNAAGDAFEVPATFFNETSQGWNYAIQDSGVWVGGQLVAINERYVTAVNGPSALAVMNSNEGQLISELMAQGLPSSFAKSLLAASYLDFQKSKGPNEQYSVDKLRATLNARTATMLARPDVVKRVNHDALVNDPRFKHMLAIYLSRAGSPLGHEYLNDILRPVIDSAKSETRVVSPGEMNAKIQAAYQKTYQHIYIQSLGIQALTTPGKNGRFTVGGVEYGVVVNQQGTLDIYPVVELPTVNVTTRPWTANDEVAFQALVSTFGVNQAVRLMYSDVQQVFNSVTDYAKFVLMQANKPVPSSLNGTIPPSVGVEIMVNTALDEAVNKIYGMGYQGLVDIGIELGIGGSSSDPNKWVNLRVPANKISELKGMTLRQIIAAGWAIDERTFTDEQLNKVIDRAVLYRSNGLAKLAADLASSTDPVFKEAARRAQVLLLLEYLEGVDQAARLVGGICGLTHDNDCQRTAGYISVGTTIIGAIIKPPTGLGQQLGLVLTLGAQLIKDPKTRQVINTTQGFASLYYAGQRLGVTTLSSTSTVNAAATVTSFLGAALAVIGGLTSNHEVMVAGQVISAASAVIAALPGGAFAQSGLATMMGNMGMGSAIPVVGWVIAIVAVIAALISVFGKKSPTVDRWPNFNVAVALPTDFDSSAKCMARIKLDYHQGGQAGRCFDVNWDAILTTASTSVGECSFEFRELTESGAETPYTRTIVKATRGQTVTSRKHGPHGAPGIGPADTNWGSCNDKGQESNMMSGDGHRFRFSFNCPADYVQVGTCEFDWGKRGVGANIVGDINCGCMPLMNSGEILSHKSAVGTVQFIEQKIAPRVTVTEEDVQDQYQKAYAEWRARSGLDQPCDYNAPDCTSYVEPYELEDHRAELTAAAKITKAIELLTTIRSNPNMKVGVIGDAVAEQSNLLCSQFAMYRCKGGMAESTDLFELRAHQGMEMVGDCRCLSGVAETQVSADRLNADRRALRDQQFQMLENAYMQLKPAPDGGG